MKSEWMGSRRGEWVAYLRAVHRVAEARRRDQERFPDGMCHGIIPFGAIQDSIEREAKRRREALAEPAPARRIGADEAGVTVAVVCPYCPGEHRHLLAAEGWDPDAWYEAECLEGRYQLRRL